MGSPEFAVRPLKLLLASFHEVVAVYTKAPKPAKRGKQLMETPIHSIVKRNNIPVYNTASFKLPEEDDKFRNLMPDVAVVVAYGIMLPQKILNIPKYGCINIHPSLLPRWRGAAPIQHTILSGDSETGISIMQMDEGLDSGPVLKQLKTPITEYDNYKTLHDKLSEIGSHLLLEVLDEIKNLSPTNQDDNNTCYAHKIEDYKIYIYDACEVAYRKVKAFFPKAFIAIDNKRIRILDADLQLHKPLHLNFGLVINENMHISFEGGILIPRVVQMEGRNPCSIEDFIRGLKINIKGKLLD
ncbi:methionyl-tRNA formyltransferase [Wolbachia pipientis]|uniref:Methionyl-tRNA formyltransferase n=2 Tax=Wolbachia pipientis TaxID=955 RepID=A0A1E7QK15_WOLPI|nr:methionyl-tRNA formyltransferase [Wolbachia pipientis]